MLGNTIADGWSHVTGRTHAFYDAYPVDCCSYALETPAGVILFDAGAGVATDQLKRSLGAVASGKGPALLFITHGHADHSGGARFVRDTYNCRVLAGRQTAEWLSSSDERLTSLDVGKRLGGYAADYPAPNCTVDQLLDDGEVIEFGGARIEVIATPGHSADHMSFLVNFAGKTTLVAGDAIFANGTVLLQDTWDCSVPQSCATIRRLAGLSFDTILPGHGDVALGNGAEVVQVALDRVNQARPPHNFF